MSVCRLIVAASLLLSAVAFGADDVDLTQPAVLEDFDDIYGDDVHQTTVGAVFGLATEGAAYAGGGYWYVYYDTSGSSITDFEDEPILEGDDASILNQDGVLIANLSTSDSENDNPYAVVGCDLLGTDTKPVSLDLSKMTSLSIKIKGEGTVRLLFKTDDLKNADWGHYGYDIDLTADWETIQIPVEDILPEKWSDPDEEGWTFDHGSDEVFKLEFKVKDGDDASIQVDEIIAGGITYADFGWETGISYTPYRKTDTKMLSVKGSNISFNLNQPQNLTLSLNDIMGNRISTLFKGNVASKTVNLNNSNISNGRYFIVLSGKNTKMVQPIAIMK